MRDPPVVAYGPVVGGETLQRPVRMTNRTSATMSYVGARWPNFGNPSGWDCPYRFRNLSGSGEESPSHAIEPGDSCTLSFGFTPKDRGAVRTYFEITYAAGEAAHSGMTRMVGGGVPPSG